MGETKVMKSEFLIDGHDFGFEAQFDSRHWRAKIWDGNGDLRGEIQCGVHGATLEGQALEEAVYDWIFRSIKDRVGVSWPGT